MGDGTLSIEHVQTEYVGPDPADESPLVAAAHKYERGAALVDQAVTMRTQGLALIREAAEVIGDPRGLLAEPERAARPSQRRQAGRRVSSEEVLAALPGTVEALSQRLDTSPANVRAHLHRLSRDGSVVGDGMKPRTYHAAVEPDRAEYEREVI